MLKPLVPKFRPYTPGQLATFSWWFAHPYLALGRVQLPLPVLQWCNRPKGPKLKKKHKQSFVLIYRSVKKKYRRKTGPRKAEIDSRYTI